MNRPSSIAFFNLISHFQGQLPLRGAAGAPANARADLTVLSRLDNRVTASAFFFIVFLLTTVVNSCSLPHALQYDITRHGQLMNSNEVPLNPAPRQSRRLAGWLLNLYPYLISHFQGQLPLRGTAGAPADARADLTVPSRLDNRVTASAFFFIVFLLTTVVNSCSFPHALQYDITRHGQLMNSNEVPLNPASRQSRRLAGWLLNLYPYLISHFQGQLPLRGTAGAPADARADLTVPSRLDNRAGVSKIELI